MNSVIDRPKISRRARLSNTASIGGLLVLLGSVLLPLFLPVLASISGWGMAVGLAASMLGIYYANRWVKKPRPEDSLDKALKSLSGQYYLFHYPAFPCDHILLAPSEVVVIETVNLEGVFSYKEGRWREKITIGRALRSIVEERLGDPIRIAQAAAQLLHHRLIENIAGAEDLPVKSMVVFVHPGAHLELQGADIPVVKVDKLRKHISTKGKKIDAPVYESVRAYLEHLTVKGG
jgi:hypothetical protein